MDTELSHHLESLEAEYRARGLSPEAARLAAGRDFGGVSRTQEAHRMREVGIRLPAQGLSTPSHDTC